jgi:anti-sigma factor RsiW
MREEMRCEDARAHLLDAQAGRLAPDLDAALRAHLEQCASCAHEDVAERALTEVLERRLPQHPASLALKRRLAAQWALAPTTRPPEGLGGRVMAWRRWPRWPRWAAPALAAALVLLVAVPLYQTRRTAAIDRVVTEVVNDHLRMLQPDRAPAVVSGGLHEVKPWFAGRLDFAPVVAFEGDAEFPLKGGAVEYVFDRRAAVFLYGRRLHTVSLLVFRPEGLALPARGTRERRARGFTVLVWRAGDLGYALVSDLDARELRTLAARFAPPA